MGAIENTWKDNLKRQMVIKLGTTTNDEATVISNMVDGGSAGALPAVTSTDNGKVLTVANGAWVAGNASGGGGDVVNVYWDTADGESVHLPYKDVDCTEGYTGLDEFWNAVFQHNVIVYECADGSVLNQYSPLLVGGTEYDASHAFVGILIYYPFIQSKLNYVGYLMEDN